jgi:hypothetical protein
VKLIYLIINFLRAVSTGPNAAGAHKAPWALAAQKLPAVTTFRPVFPKQRPEITCKYIVAGFANRYHNSFIPLAAIIKRGLHSDIKSFITIFV